MPPIPSPSSAKRIAIQMFVIKKSNERKDFILTGFVCDINRLRKELPVQSKLFKHKNKVWKLSRIKNEENGVAPVSLLLTVNIFQTCLKSGSHLSKKLVLLDWLKAFYKLWKMLFISSWKLFSFSRYLSFCHDFLVM